MAQPTTSPELGPYRKVQGKAEADLRRILEVTAKRIEARIALLKPGVGGVVRKAQLTATLNAVRRMQRTMWLDGVTPLVERGWKDAEDAAESAIEAMTRIAYGALPDKAAEALVRSLRASAESGLKSDAARRKRELSQRVYRLRSLDEGKVEELIRSGLISGLSAKELAATVRDHVNPATPGGSSYAAMRLARTEINNAFHERQMQGATRPGVKAVQWNLSGSHKVPDECNLYAAHEPYAPGEVPDKPHPQCFCYLTYVTEAPGEFQAKLAAGDFDDEIERRTRENLARLGQPVGDVTPPKAKRDKEPLSGSKAMDSVPKGLYKRGTMTPQQRQALKVYESGWFAVINGFLRNKRWGEEDYKQEERDVGRIDSAMQESPLPEDIQVWRGLFNARTVFGDDLDNDLTGFKWQELGYGSTTTNEAITQHFITGSKDPNAKPVDDAVKMVVTVKGGVHALQTSSESKGSKANGPQSEITLERGLIWKVVRDNGVDDSGVRLIEVEVSRIG